MKIMLFLYHDITYDEVRDHIYKCKNNKPPGLDIILCKVLQYEDITFLLFKVFVSRIMLYLVTGVRQLLPRFQRVLKKSYLPLSYRGIRL